MHGLPLSLFLRLHPLGRGVALSLLWLFSGCLLPFFVRYLTFARAVASKRMIPLALCVFLFVCARPRSRVAVVQFRLYQDGDFARLYAIEEFCFQPPIRFGRGTMRQLVDSSVCATWIAEEDDAILGFAIVEWTREPDLITAYIPTLEVLPDQRRRGIGAELLRRVEASATAAGAGLIWLHVDAENDPAIGLYRAAGYQRSGRHEHYYARYRAAEIYMKALAVGLTEAGDGNEEQSGPA